MNICEGVRYLHQRPDKLRCVFRASLFLQLLYCRKHFRETLKQQMADSDTDKKKSFQEKSLESQKSIAFDNDCKQKDLNAFITKHKYLQGFRNTNKDVSTKNVCLSVHLTVSTRL